MSSHAVFKPVRRFSWVRAAALVAALVTSGGLLVTASQQVARAEGPNAIVAGFDANSYGPNDDGSYPCTGLDTGVPSGCTATPISLPFSVNFFGTSYDSLYLNNNGNLTFAQ